MQYKSGAVVMPTFHPRAEIVPGLWVGSMKDSNDAAFFLQRGIGLVVNCTKNLPCNVKNIECLRIPVDDNPAENARMFSMLQEAVNTIDNAIRSGEGVLVHCYAGMQRSCAIAAAYLMHRRRQLGLRVSALQAMRTVKNRKPEAFEPYPTFLPALQAFETRR